MAEALTWGLYGHGLIGGHLKEQLAKKEVADRMGLSSFPEFVVRKSGVFDKDLNELNVSPEDLDIPDITFLTIPSSGNGDLAMGIMRPALGLGKMVVTAEKGGLASNFAELQELSDNFERLGIRATVGGGTRLIHMLREYSIDLPNVTQIHAVLNGTLTSTYSLYGPTSQNRDVMSLGQAIAQAKKLGFAEPDSGSDFDVIRGEAEGDIPKKTAILFNAAGLGENVLDWQRLQFPLSDTEIERSLREAKVRRFIVSFLHKRHGMLPDVDIISGFDEEHDGWRIVGGFQHVDHNPLLAPLADLTQASNAAVIGLGPNESDGIYVPGGPGAGPGPTVNAMLDDVLIRTRARRNPYL